MKFFVTHSVNTTYLNVKKTHLSVDVRDTIGGGKLVLVDFIVPIQNDLHGSSVLFGR